ncbi:methyltransferase domain-containing protein [Muriicola sp.]|uniref:methyltransferase domain-containing protein n=1 Tax=Muriicola sp. TaxID=2020856 RepID=UPI003C7719AB
MHHWTDLESGFSELARVLKPKGKFVIFHLHSTTNGRILVGTLLSKNDIGFQGHDAHF